jgi:teichuronic acid biosynthesis protein TuaE
MTKNLIPGHMWSTAERWTYYATVVAAFLGVSVLAWDVGPFTLFPYRVLVAALGMLLLWHAARSRAELRRFSHVKLYVLFLFVWGLYGGVSMMWAVSTTAAALEFGLLVVGTAFILLTIFYVETELELRRLHWIWIGVFVAFVGIGLWEHITGLHLPVSGYFGTTDRRFLFRPTAVFGNPNDYAAFLAIGLPFVLMKFLHGRSIVKGLLLPVTGGVAVYLILMTGARASLFAVLLELVVLVALGAADRTFRSRLNRWLKLGVIVSAVMLPNAIPYVDDLGGRTVQGSMVDQVASTVDQVAETAEQAGAAGGSVNVRWNLVRNGVVFIGETYGVGVGAGNAEWWMEHRPEYDTSTTYSLHNWWLELTVTYGVLIAMGFLIFYLGMLLGLWRAWLHAVKPEMRALYGGLVVSMVGFVLASLGPSSVVGLKPIWVLWGSGLAALSIARTERASFECTS